MGTQQALSREQLLKEFGAAYERLIARAQQVKSDLKGPRPWGARDIVAHLAGWELMAGVRIPHIVAGMAPLEEEDPKRADVMNDAINAAFTGLTVDEDLNRLCGVLRQAYQRTVELLKRLDDRFFQPGDYIYQRTKGVIEHCEEHLEMLE